MQHCQEFSHPAAAGPATQLTPTSQRRGAAVLLSGSDTDSDDDADGSDNSDSVIFANATPASTSTVRIIGNVNTTAPPTAAQNTMQARPHRGTSFSTANAPPTVPAATHPAMTAAQPATKAHSTVVVHPHSASTNGALKGKKPSTPIPYVSKVIKVRPEIAKKGNIAEDSGLKGNKVKRKRQRKRQRQERRTMKRKEDASQENDDDKGIVQLRNTTNGWQQFDVSKERRPSAVPDENKKVEPATPTTPPEPTPDQTVSPSWHPRCNCARGCYENLVGRWWQWLQCDISSSSSSNMWRLWRLRLRPTLICVCVGSWCRALQESSGCKKLNGLKQLLRKRRPSIPSTSTAPNTPTRR